MTRAPSGGQGDAGQPGRSDADLMQAIHASDREAFAVLFDRYHRLVFSTAVRVLNDAAAAEDVTQEVFLRLWRRPGMYVEARGNFVGWLLSVTRNRAIDEIRARGRRALPESQVGARRDDEATVPVTEARANEEAARELEQVELDDQRALVRAALAQLPEDQRIAIEMAYYRGLTQAEISEALTVPLGTIKTRIRLGMQKLRAALEGQVGVIETRPSGTEGP